MTGIIYCYHCIITGKKYIGQTRNHRRREIARKNDVIRNKHPNNQFECALREYGYDGFIYGQIEETDELDDREIYWIDYYNTIDEGYNTLRRGAGKKSIHEGNKTIDGKPTELGKQIRNEWQRNKYNNMTDEEKREYNRKVVEWNRIRVSNMPPEERTEYYRKYNRHNQERIESMADEERAEQKRMRREQNRRYYHSLSPEKRREMNRRRNQRKP